MKLAISIVSHGHGALASLCVAQMLQGFSNQTALILLTHNIPEPPGTSSVIEAMRIENDAVKKVWNDRSLGFAENHNLAFLGNQHDSHGAYGLADWLMIVNPDLDWVDSKIFASLQRFLETTSSTNDRIGAATLRQALPSGEPVEFARYLMTPWQFAKRTFNRLTRQTNIHVEIPQADWVNAACLVVRREAFESLGGFDERYRLYCEDVDFCLRLRLAGWRLAVLDSTVVHDTRRDSLRNWKFLLWHISSLLKLWSSSAFWSYLIKRAQGRIEPIVVIRSEEQNST